MKYSTILALMLISLATHSSAFATDIISVHGVHFNPFSSSHHKSQLILPSFQELVAMPSAKRDRYLKAFQAALVELEKESGKSVAEFDSQILFERLFQNAYAEAATADFCINQGVLRPINNCDQSPGVNMHDFDTHKDLDVLGSASQCKNSDEKPCSPIFGFDSDGGLLCTNTNLTRVCAKLSKQPGTLSFADVAISCSLKSPSPGKAKVDCGKLISFYEDQIKLVQTHCANQPTTLACGVLREQFKSVGQDYKEKTTALRASPDAQNVAELASKVNALVNDQGESVPCPPAGAAPSGCVNKTLPAVKIPSMDSIIETAALEEGKNTCAQVTLADQSVFVIDARSTEVKFSYKPPGPSTFLNLSKEDAVLMMQLSDEFTKKDGKLKVPDAALGVSYLPIQFKPDAGDITQTFPVAGKDGKPQKDKDGKMIGQKLTLKTRGWVTGNGTQIRYVTDGLPKEMAGKVLEVGLTPKGGVEQLIGFDETR